MFGCLEQISLSLPPPSRPAPPRPLALSHPLSLPAPASFFKEVSASSRQNCPNQRPELSPGQLALSMETPQLPMLVAASHSVLSAVHCPITRSSPRSLSARMPLPPRCSSASETHCPSTNASPPVPSVPMSFPSSCNTARTSTALAAPRASMPLLNRLTHPRGHRPSPLLASIPVSPRCSIPAARPAPSPPLPCSDCPPLAPLRCAAKGPPANSRAPKAAHSQPPPSTRSRGTFR